MKHWIYFVLGIALLGAGVFPAAPITSAQGPGDSFTSAVPLDVRELPPDISWHRS